MAAMVSAPAQRGVRRRWAGRRATARCPCCPCWSRCSRTGGLRRGSAVAVHGSASLLLALLAGPSRRGAWCAVVGLPGLGLVAAAEAGVELERLALVPDPGRDWAAVAAALLDAMEVVVVAPRGRVPDGDVRRLAARARQRGAVLVPYGSVAWPGAELRLSVGGGVWEGLGDGSGRLRSRRVVVRSEGRGSAARLRELSMWLPAPDGEIRPAPTLHAVLTPPDLSPARGADRRAPAPARSPRPPDSTRIRSPARDTRSHTRARVPQRRGGEDPVDRGAVAGRHPPARQPRAGGTAGGRPPPTRDPPDRRAAAPASPAHRRPPTAAAGTRDPVRPVPPCRLDGLPRSGVVPR